MATGGTPAPSSGTHVRVAAPGGPIVLPLADLLRRHGAADLVRLRAGDFAALPRAGRVLVHFNLGHTSNAAGRRYAIVPIVMSGWRDGDGREVLPVVDLDQIRLATCLEVKRDLSLDRMSPELFRDSLPHIKTAAQLRVAMIERYQALLPSACADDIAASGCSATWFLMEAGRSNSQKRSSAQDES